MLPYDADALAALIESYNRAMWPAQPAALALAALALFLTARQPPAGYRWVALVLVAGWTWTAVGYLAGSYAALNWAGWVYAAVFMVQTLAMAWRGVLRPWPADGGAAWRPGLALASFALLVNPVIDIVLGGGAAAAGLVGLLPDATAAFTLGLLAASRAAPRWLSLLPALWCGWSAAWWWQLQTPERAVLPALAIALCAWWLLTSRARRRRPGSQGSRNASGTK